jgi:hypothetical protein
MFLYVSSMQEDISKWLVKMMINVYNYIGAIIHQPDYTIDRMYIQYKADMIVDVDEADNVAPLWEEESRMWSGTEHWYDWDVTGQQNNINDIMSTIPDNVADFVLFVKYTYGNKSYKYVSESPTFSWPPESKGTFKFKLPINEVWATSHSGRKAVNITSTFKKISGPCGDFHGQDVKIGNVMKRDYPKITVINMLGERVLDETDSVIRI